MLNDAAAPNALQFLTKYLPGILPFCLFPEKKWFEIEAKLKLRYSSIAKEIQISGEAATKTHIYDLMILAEQHRDQFAIDFLNYVNSIFLQLQDLIPAHQHRLITRNCLELIQNFDTKSSRYVNMLGEILTLFTIMNSKKFDFVCTEKVIGSPTSIDFEFRTTDGKKSYLVEVFNVSLDTSKISSSNDLKKFLFHRIAEKIKKKKLIDIKKSANMPILIVIVLWGDVINLYSQKSFFSANHQLSGIDIAYSQLIQYQPSPGRFTFKFSTTEAILKEFSKASKH